MDQHAVRAKLNVPNLCSFEENEKKRMKKREWKKEKAYKHGSNSKISDHIHSNM